MLRKEREILGGHLSQQIYKDVLSQPLYTFIKNEKVVKILIVFFFFSHKNFL